MFKSRVKRKSDDEDLKKVQDKEKEMKEFLIKKFENFGQSNANA